MLFADPNFFSIFHENCSKRDFRKAKVLRRAQRSIIFRNNSEKVQQKECENVRAVARIFTFSVSDMVKEGLLFRSEFCYNQRLFLVLFNRMCLAVRVISGKSLFCLTLCWGKQIKGIKLGVGVFYNRVSAVLINIAKFSYSSIFVF